MLELKEFINITKRVRRNTRNTTKLLQKAVAQDTPDLKNNIKKNMLNMKELQAQIDQLKTSKSLKSKIVETKGVLAGISANISDRLTKSKAITKLTGIKGKKTLWDVTKFGLVLVRKFIVVFSAIIGVVVIGHKIGFSTDNVIGGLYGYGAEYFKMLTSTVFKLFSWFCDLFNLKIVPNVPQNAPSWYWWGPKEHTWYDKGIMPEGLSKIIETAKSQDFYKTPYSTAQESLSWGSWLWYLGLGLLGVGILYFGYQVFTDPSFLSYFSKNPQPSTPEGSTTPLAPANTPFELLTPRASAINPSTPVESLTPRAGPSSLPLAERVSEKLAKGTTNTVKAGLVGILGGVAKKVGGDVQYLVTERLNPFSEYNSYDRKVQARGAYEVAQIQASIPNKEYYPFTRHYPCDTWFDYFKKSFTTEPEGEKFARAEVIKDTIRGKGGKRSLLFDYENTTPLSSPAGSDFIFIEKSKPLTTETVSNKIFPITEPKAFSPYEIIEPILEQEEVKPTEGEIVTPEQEEVKPTEGEMVAPDPKYLNHKVPLGVLTVDEVQSKLESAGLFTNIIKVANSLPSTPLTKPGVIFDLAPGTVPSPMERPTSPELAALERESKEAWSDHNSPISPGINLPLDSPDSPGKHNSFSAANNPVSEKEEEKIASAIEALHKDQGGSVITFPASTRELEAIFNSKAKAAGHPLNTFPISDLIDEWDNKDPELLGKKTGKFRVNIFKENGLIPVREHDPLFFLTTDHPLPKEWYEYVKSTKDHHSYFEKLCDIIVGKPVDLSTARYPNRENLKFDIFNQKVETPLKSAVCLLMLTNKKTLIETNQPRPFYKTYRTKPKNKKIITKIDLERADAPLKPTKSDQIFSFLLKFVFVFFIYYSFLKILTG